MDHSTNLELPFIQAAQAQKHVTHNAAILSLDALVQLSVLARDLDAAPALPDEGDRYIVGADPVGVWQGQADAVAAFQDGAWGFFPPKPGWIAYDLASEQLIVFDGAAWRALQGGLKLLQLVERFGLGTTADAENPFAVKANKALWTAKEAGEGGDGDLRFTFNKEAPADVLSLLFQTGYSARAELGLVGDDDLRLKTSADGGAWHDALSFDAATGGGDLSIAEAFLPSASVCDVGAAKAMRIAVDGNAVIDSFGARAHCLRLIRFTGTPILRHLDGQLDLPGAADIAVEPGDTALAASNAAGAFRILVYQRATGKALRPLKLADVVGEAVGGRRNAFLNPCFDVAQGYSGPFTFGGGPAAPLPIEMLKQVATAGGGSYRGELVDFTPGQSGVPGNPKRYLSVTELSANDGSGYPGLFVMFGPASLFAGETVTFSLYGRSHGGSLALAISFYQAFGSGGSPTVYGAGGLGAITLEPNWQRLSMTVTLPSLSGKSIGTNNYLGLHLLRGILPRTFEGDFCGLQLEQGSGPTALNPVPMLEAEQLCRGYFERVETRAVNGTVWVPCQPKRAVPTATTTLGTVSNATRNGCQLTHTAAGNAVVSFDARL